MFEKITNSLSESNINKKNPIIVGVSGGPDSVALLHSLHGLGFRLIVAHLDHSLREDSASDYRTVKRMAEGLYIPFFGLHVDTIKYSKTEKLSIEEAGRILRYKFFFDIANQESAQVVSVGHTADDQAETILMHLLRGSGLSGIKGMQVKSMTSWDSKIPLIRPLINVWREEIDVFCEENNLSPLVDQTNTDPKFLRNKIRHELIPILEEYNPNIKQRFVTLSKIATEDFKGISEMLESRWNKLVDISEDKIVNMSADRFNANNLSMKRMLIRKSIQLLKLDSNNIPFNDVETAIEFIAHPLKNRSIKLFSTVNIQVQNKMVYLFGDEQELQLANIPKIFNIIKISKIPGKNLIPPNWIFEGEEMEFSEISFDEIKNNKDPFSAYLDANIVEDGIVLRNPKEGDYFQPLGMNGKGMKLFDFFINQKIYKVDRSNWPLLCTKKNDIIWVVGQRISHHFRVTKKTKKILLVKVKKNE